MARFGPCFQPTGVCLQALLSYTQMHRYLAHRAFMSLSWTRCPPWYSAYSALTLKVYSWQVEQVDLPTAICLTGRVCVSEYNFLNLFLSWSPCPLIQNYRQKHQKYRRLCKFCLNFILHGKGHATFQDAVWKNKQYNVYCTVYTHFISAVERPQAWNRFLKRLMTI